MTHRLATALAALSDADLKLLREFAAEAQGPTAGLLAAIENAADWEWHRRRGVEFEMLPLGDAIDDGDLDAALGLAIAFHASIADRFVDPAAVRELLVAIVETLIAGTRH